MDPALWELLRAEEDEDASRPLEAIIRLIQPGIEIPGVRMVARFGPIATCRIDAADVLTVRAHRGVASLKAARRLGAGRVRQVGPGARSKPPSPGPTDIRRPSGLETTGAGVVVASIDWGLDVDSPAFRLPPGPGSGARAGGTRLLALWDQRGQPIAAPPQPYGYGVVHDRATIDDALLSGRPYERLAYHPAAADQGGGTHGTHVLDIAAGNGHAGGPQGIAPEADLVFVHLADRDTEGLANLGDSVRLLEAIDFIRRTAAGRPCVINTSLGRHGGPHDGTTLGELAVDHLLSATAGLVVVKSTGNYFRSRAHASGTLTPGEVRALHLEVDPDDATPNELEIWYSGLDEFEVRVTPPGQSASEWVPLDERAEISIGGQVIGRVYHRATDPNNGANHIDMFLDPAGCSGFWTVELQARRVRSGRFDAWLERDDICPRCQTRFVPADSDPAVTTGTLANGHLDLTVGAYDGHDPARPAGVFSSAGPTRDGRAKPDLAAPGVEVLAARSAPAGATSSPGQLVRKSGTSMAAPHVTGAVALCLQLGLAAGRLLLAREVRDLVLGSCEPAPSAARLRLGHGYLDIPRLLTATRAALAAPHPRESVMDTDATALLTGMPATAYRELLYRPSGPIARTVRDRYKVLALPGRRVPGAAQPGDVLLEIQLGRLDGGRCTLLDAPSVLVVARPLLPGQLLLRPHEDDLGDGAQTSRFEIPNDANSAEDTELDRLINRGLSENQITNALFYARNPRPPGATLLPRSTAARQWQAIRDAEVRPGLLARVRVPTSIDLAITASESELAEGEQNPPTRFADLPLGVDLSDYQGTRSGKHVVALPLSTFRELAHIGKVFAIAKSSQYVAEKTFRDHYDHIREAGLIRGSYHFFTERAVAEQVRLVLGLVGRVGPGELAPSLDVEDGSKRLWNAYHYTYDGTGTAAGSTALLDALQAWLDAVEAALGRTPLVYTGVIWRDGLRSPRMSQYPLWTLPGRFPLGGWARVDIWQYAEDGEPQAHPYHETGVHIPGVDFDAYDGTIWGLRGLADLGRIGIATGPVGPTLAHNGPDRHVHLVQGTNDVDLMSNALPGLGGDPVLRIAGDVTRLYFRSDGRVIEASRSGTSGSWNVDDLTSVTGVRAVHEPSVVVTADQRTVVFWGEDDDWHLCTRSSTGPWTVTPVLNAARRASGRTVPPSSGQPVVYRDPTSGEVRVLGRAGVLGHLTEVSVGQQGWTATDVTATAVGPRGIPPAATYSPAVYAVGADTVIVYRALRGELWQINRTTRRATGLTAAVAGSVLAAGHPCCFVLHGEPHVVYRGVDRNLHELILHGGSWRAATIPCNVPVASDPTCTADGAVAVRATDGTVRVSTFDGQNWTCTVAARPPTVVGLPAAELAPPPRPETPDSVADRIFFARHPERDGRRLAPDEIDLIREWRLVRASVGSATEAEAGPDVANSSGGSWLRALTTAGETWEAETEGPGSVLDDIGKTVGDVMGGALGLAAKVIAKPFDDFVQLVDDLEKLAIRDGYSLVQRVTAFRKLYYDSQSSGAAYPGAPSGGVWNILIPGAASTPLPPSWRARATATKVTTLASTKVLCFNLVSVDVSHVLTGLDARNHPTTVSLGVLGFPLVQMRSNLEAATFVGDLGSVVVEYIRASKRSFRDTAMELDATLLDTTFDKFAPGSDLAADADAYLVPVDPSRSFALNLSSYYRTTVGGWRRRWQRFAQAIGLGAFTPAPAVMGTYWQTKVVGTFSGSTEKWHSDVRDQVFNAALAYAAARGKRVDVVNVLADPGPGVMIPTFWELYWNASGWVLDEFLLRLKRAVRVEMNT